LRKHWSKQNEELIADKQEDELLIPVEQSLCNDWINVQVASNA
jgi:hypothetical protein